VSTFGACTGGMAAALVNLEILEREELVKNAQVNS
jgi:acetylornithine/succinyldiaminopimelate/putrescine aminotransferase